MKLLPKRYFIKFDVPEWGDNYFEVYAHNQKNAIKLLIKGSKVSVPQSKIHVWKGNGLPERIAGSYIDILKKKYPDRWGK